MTKTLVEVDLEWDVHSCEECAYKRTLEDGSPYCYTYNLPREYMPYDRGCMFGANKNKFK